MTNNQALEWIHFKKNPYLTRISDCINRRFKETRGWGNMRHIRYPEMFRGENESI